MLGYIKDDLSYLSIDLSRPALIILGKVGTRKNNMIELGSIHMKKVEVK